MDRLQVNREQITPHVTLTRDLGADAGMDIDDLRFYLESEFHLLPGTLRKLLPHFEGAPPQTVQQVTVRTVCNAIARELQAQLQCEEPFTTA
ncbi:MAG: hypothetical protein HYR90_02305 [Candidatus Andersenbacteria bacterium]|nr:hypothetical protein [Candidatus Andersenbacteria bacterium]MBI3250991.1 hypothetical protein [Candidatus Andersenbacteria bacterium]